MKLRLRWLYRLGPYVPLLVMALWSTAALARGGGGESYNSGRSSSDGDDGAIVGFILQLLIELTIEHPCVGVPLLIVFIGGIWYFRSQQASTATRKVLDRAEAERRTNVSAGDVTAWVNALKTKDPAFDLLAFFDRTKRLFLDVQEAWFHRNLDPVRRFLSDATYSRLANQQKILDLNGVRDAIAEMQVLDLQIIGLEQTPYFDTVHVRIRAQNRDDDAPAHYSDEQARALALKKAPEQFLEVWSFVRKPGAQTKAGDQQGNCPNCGAPFAGGAANRCEFCKAVVNSGNYDWVLAEITQGSEYGASHQAVEGIARARQQDPGLNIEMLEDRASLCFWKWIEAQATGEASRLSKIATPEFTARLKADLDALKAQNRRKVFLECAVGAVNTRSIVQDNGYDLANIELRWSARMGIGPAGEKPPALPSVPQRWVFVLQRKSGAQTPTGNGMSSSRCATCGAPLSDNGAVSCEFCGSMLASGEKDWVIRDITSWETFQITAAQRERVQSQRLADRVPDREERERLMYLMAAMAAADGVVDQRERQLLQMCAERWSVPWANVELALGAGPGLFERLIAKGSGEAESLLRQLVQMALVDGRIDRKERRLLDQAAAHLGLVDKLPAMLKG